MAALVGVLALVALPATATMVDDHEKEMTAEIVEVDTEANELTVKQMDAEIHEPSRDEEYEAERMGVEGRQVVLRINEDTRILEDGGNMIALAGLEEGERVNITYTMSDGEMRIIGVDRWYASDESHESRR